MLEAAGSFEGDGQSMGDEKGLHCAMLRLLGRIAIGSHSSFGRILQDVDFVRLLNFHGFKAGLGDIH